MILSQYTPVFIVFERIAKKYPSIIYKTKFSKCSKKVRKFSKTFKKMVPEQFISNIMSLQTDLMVPENFLIG